MADTSPRVSFALPVRNGGTAIRRCLDSLLAQDLTDIEVVVSDNASTDGTQDVLREYAARDSRVRLFLNEADVGQIENFNRVVHLARGEYFRWIGAEDWLEPEYASRCVRELDGDPGAIVASNYFRIHLDGGETRYEEFEGELLESDRPERRFDRMLWTFHTGDALYEPLYALIRRDVLLQTSLIRMMVKADRMLAAELSLLGRFVHIRECLAHRWKPIAESVHSEKYLKRYRPWKSSELQSAAWRLLRCLISIIWAAPLSLPQRLNCLGTALRFYWLEARIRGRRHFAEIRRSLGLTRQNLGAVRGVPR